MIMLNYVIITYLLVNIFLASVILITSIADNGIDKTPQQFLDFLLMTFFGIPIITIGFILIIFEEIFGDDK